MTRTAYTVDDLDRITKFVHGLNLLGKQHNVFLGAEGDLWLGTDATAFNVELDSIDEGYVLTQVVTR